jgi:hypothetical protein
MIQRTAIPKSTLYLGLLFQILFVIGAIVFYKERVLYADTAHFAAEITGGGRFFIGHRWIAIFSRILPFTSTYLGASIKISLILYSVNLALIYTVPYLILAFFFKNRSLAVTLLLFQFVFLFRSNFLAISELQHGLVLLLLLWGWMRYLTLQKRMPSRNIWTYVMLLFVMNSHPMMLIAFFGSATILKLKLTYWNDHDRQLLYPVALLFFLVSSVLFFTQYEANILMDSANASLGKVHVYHVRLMIHTLLTDYYPTIIVGGIGVIIMASVLKIRQQIVVLSTVAITAVLVYLRFAHQTLTLTFFEVYISIIPFLLFVGLGQEMTVLSEKAQRLLLILLGVLMLWQGYRSVDHSSFYTDRLQIYERVLSQMQEANCRNAILPFYESPMNKVVDFYATPFESYLLSKIDRDRENDGSIFTYLPANEIDPTAHPLGQNHFIGLGMDTLSYYPYSRYPRFNLDEQEVCTTTIHY